MNDLIKGKIKINKSGFGFLIPEIEDMQDIFVSREDLNSALNNDTVMVRVVKKAKGDYKAEGKVIEVLERSDSVLVGQYEKVKNFGFVILDGKHSHDVFIPSGKDKKAKNGDKVVIKIIDFKSRDKNPTGEIVEVLGGINDVGVEILAISKKYEIPTEFKKETLDFARSLPQEIREEDIKDRQDFRDLFTVTIDGADAKDFDDAISIDRNGDNYTLYVHIADVANYVKEKTDINADAYLRGNSVYLMDRVIPMLPYELSNNLCSLNPNVDRLAMSVKMEIDRKGNVLDYKFYESVINSNYRLIYDDVSDYLEGKNHKFTDQELMDKLTIFNELHKILENKRQEAGDIDFNFKESKIVLDESGKPIEVGIAARRVANMLIESFMVLTNEVVGGHFAKRDISFIYRVHEKPTLEKETSFRKMIAKFGFMIKGRDLQPKDYQNILKESEGSKYEMTINNLMLRSLTKADYRKEQNIHFGLATENYSHFTSPIRRYSDLIAHRILKGYLHDNLKKESKSYHKKLDDICEHISITERRAEDAEREVEDMKKCEYMLDKIGNEYKGVISSLTNFGFFVELDNTIEGLVAFRSLDDYYEFNEEEYAIIGETTKKRFELGQEVQIKVTNVNVELREIDFGLIENE